MLKGKIVYELEIGVDCPYCKESLSIEKEDCGKIIKCGECKKEFELGEINKEQTIWELIEETKEEE